MIIISDGHGIHMYRDINVCTVTGFTFLYNDRDRYKHMKLVCRNCTACHGPGGAGGDMSVPFCPGRAGQSLHPSPSRD